MFQGGATGRGYYQRKIKPKKENKSRQKQTKLNNERTSDNVGKGKEMLQKKANN